MLKTLFGGAAAISTTAFIKEKALAAGAGEYCGYNVPPGPECDAGLTCCSAGSGANNGICLTDDQCNTPSIIPCVDDVNCPGRVVCCGDGFCSSDFWGECPTTTTSEPTTTTPEPTTTTPAPTTTTTPAPTTTTTPAPGPNTGTGSDVEVTYPGVPGASITFGTVTVAGATTITPVSSSSLPSLPDSSIYQNANGDWFEIATTATYSGGIQICLPSDDPSDRLLHLESGAWVDVTSVGSPFGGIVCGVVTSLSPFAVVPLLGGIGDDDDDDSDSADDDDHTDSSTDDDDDHAGKPHPPKHPQASKGGADSVVTLPSTGTGPESSRIGALGLTLAAGAAAAAAARVLRTPDTDRTES